MNNLNAQVAMCEMLMDDLYSKIRMRQKIIEYDANHDHYISNIARTVDGEGRVRYTALPADMDSRGCKQDQILEEIKLLRRELLNLSDFIRDDGGIMNLRGERCNDTL